MFISRKQLFYNYSSVKKGQQVIQGNKKYCDKLFKNKPNAKLAATTKNHAPTETAKPPEWLDKAINLVKSSEVSIL